MLLFVVEKEIASAQFPFMVRFFKILYVLETVITMLPFQLIKTLLFHIRAVQDSVREIPAVRS